MTKTDRILHHHDHAVLPMTLAVEPYLQQLASWPQSGRHIMAQFDDESIIVYQAYRPSIARHAVEHQRFGGEFSFNRMSWIKPNFLWMMYRAGWATKAGQEHILAVRLKRSFFDGVLESSVESSFGGGRFTRHEEWRAAVARSDVRLQWDPDHDPGGRSIPRRAVQLGLRGEMLRRYGEAELLGIEDITDFVTEQRVQLQKGIANLLTPVERIYKPSTQTAAAAIGIEP